MTIEYCCWYHPDEDPKTSSAEIEAHIDRAAQLDPWLREHPPVVEWKLNWPAFSSTRGTRSAVAIGDAHERAAPGRASRAGRPVNGFAAVEDCSFLNLGGIPRSATGRATCAWRTPTTSTS